jgi:hypothetical protein
MFHETSVKEGLVASNARRMSEDREPRPRSRIAWLGGAAAVLVIALVGASASNDPVGDPRASTTMASPEATMAIGTPAPTAADSPLVDAANGSKPGKGKDHGKGKGHGN